MTFPWTGPLALVPAAGRSVRMGRPKALLPLGATDFIGILVAALRRPEAGVGRILVVHRVDDRALATRLEVLAAEAAAGLTPLQPVLVSGDGDMLESVRAGWNVAGDERGALVWPVDAPLTASGTVSALLQAVRRTPGRVVRPCHGGRPGHPLWIPAELLSAPSPPGAAPGLRGLIEALSPDPLDLPVDDPGCLVNLNTPEAVRLALGEER